MSKYLIDLFLRNLTIEQTALKKINEDISEIQTKVNTDLGQQSSPGPNTKLKQLDIAYIIRFDGKGYRLTDFDQVIKYFSDANNIERIFITADSLESKNSAAGKRIEIRLDPGNASNCYLVVEDDDKDWVDAVFAKLKDRISKYSNKNWIVQNQIMAMFVQIIGVVFVFFLSCWVAVKLSPLLALKEGLYFVFLATFLLLSNLWTFTYGWILRLINRHWPIIEFKDRTGWIGYWQNFVVGIAILVLSWMFRYLIHTSGAIFK